MWWHIAVMASNGLRERARRAVQAELAEAAQELFLAQGYEATTIDQIADTAGISKRSFFRYFASKEDVVIGKYDLHGDDLVAALSDRPLDEPVWDALRRTFDVVVDYYADRHRRDRAAVMQSIVASSPSLSARYLEKLQRNQDRLSDTLRKRAARRGEKAGGNEALARAIVGSAYACLIAAMRAALSSDDPLSLASRLDEVMEALRPTTPAEPHAARGAAAVAVKRRNKKPKR
jgi:AcrR family transcriptional regulator